MRLRSVSRVFCALLWRICVLLTSHSLTIFISVQTHTHTRAHLNYTLYTLYFILFSADLGQVTNNSVTWNVTLPAYWTVQISIEDATFDEGWSQPVRILHHIPPPLFTRGTLALCIQNPHFRFKFNQATIVMSAAYHPPSLPSPTPTRKYQ